MSTNVPRPEQSPRPDIPHIPQPSVPTPYLSPPVHPEHRSQQEIILGPPAGDILPSRGADGLRPRSVTSKQHSHAGDHIAPAPSTEVPLLATSDEASNSPSAKFPPEPTDAQADRRSEVDATDHAESTATPEDDTPAVEYHVGASAMTDARSSLKPEELGAERTEDAIEPAEPSVEDNPQPPENTPAQTESTTERPPIDADLAEKIIAANNSLGQEHVDRILAAHEGYSRPVHVGREEDGSEFVDPYFHERRFLAELPGVVAAATSAGLAPADTEAIIVEVLHTVPEAYRDFSNSDIMMGYLAKGLEGFAVRVDEAPSSPEEIHAILTELVSINSETIELALSSFAAARELGLNVSDSMTVVKNYTDTTNWRQQGYYMHGLRDALNDLQGSNADVDTIKTVLQAMDATPGETRHQGYEILTNAVLYAPQTHQMTPAEYLGLLRERIETGMTIDEALSVESPAIGSNDAPQPVVEIPSEKRDKYFPKQEGPLHNATLPYQKERSLVEGLEDIKGLTHARGRYGDQVSEGAWVHDPETGTWYSLGGKTNFTGTGVRHRHPAYDISQLSETPYMVHIHPKEGIGLSEDRFGFVFPTAADYKAVAAWIENAQGPLDMRAVISHPMGITEFTFPNDAEAIRTMADAYAATTYALYEEMTGGVHRGLMYTAAQYGDDAVTEFMVRRINDLLPEGFRIRNYPTGTDLRDMIERRY